MPKMREATSTLNRESGLTGVSRGSHSHPPDIRVCLVGPSLDILGGQAVQLARLLDRLRETPGIRVEFIPMNPRLPGPLRVLQRVKYIRTIATLIAYGFILLRRIPRYDVVHAFSPSYWAFLLGPVPALAIARFYGRAALLNYHSGEAEDHLARWKSAVPLARLAHRIVVPSAWLREVFSRHGLDAEPIHNFVEVDAIPYRRRRHLEPVFLSNRNLEPHYNVACSLRAFAMIQQRIPAAQLTVAGYGSQRNELEAMARDLELRNVRFVGRVPHQEMGRLLDAADVLLNSPDVDNMPLSLIEAQAAGLPIVSTSSGGIPYVVRHEETGLLVPTGDHVALASAALRLFEDDGLAERLTHAARRECLANYTWESVQEKWLALYAGMVSRSPIGTRQSA
jgi:glycosyltransferase involved in cell wall biosynthesis